MPISDVRTAAPNIATPRPEPLAPGGRSLATGSAGPSFGSVLRQAIDEVNQLQLHADAELEKLATGQVTDLHTVSIAVQKASLALDLTIAIRNKVLEAYQQIERMQV